MRTVPAAQAPASLAGPAASPLSAARASPPVPPPWESPLGFDAWQSRSRASAGGLAPRICFPRLKPAQHRLGINRIVLIERGDLCRRHLRGQLVELLLRGWLHALAGAGHAQRIAPLARQTNARPFPHYCHVPASRAVLSRPVRRVPG